MRDETEIVRDRQLAIRRELDRRGVSLKAVALDSGMSYSTIQSYFPADQHAQPAVMSVAALYRLFGAIPDDLLSLLLPAGRVIVRVPEGMDYDEVSTSCRDFLAAKDRAHHPDSENGRDIGPTEEGELASKVVTLRAAA